MKMHWISPILIFCTGSLWASSPITLWLEQPVARMAVVFYFKQSGSLESEKAIAFIDLLEKALLDSPEIYVSSVSEYVKIRKSKPISMAAYWKELNVNGIINPLIIKTPNTEVYEKILEYEIQETQKMLATVPKGLVVNNEIKTVLQFAASLISIYQRGLGFRDRIESSTRSWEGVPVLGLLRSVGQNLVNPMVRKMIYSKPILEKMRSNLRVHLNQFKRQVREDYEGYKNQASNAGISIIEKTLIEDWSSMELFKPFADINKALILKLGISFFSSLPQEVKEDVAWFWLHQSEKIEVLKKSPKHILNFFNNTHPQTKQIVDSFIMWTGDPKIKNEINSLAEIPLTELMQSFAQLLLEDLNKPPTGRLEPRLMAEFTRRNLFGSAELRYRIVLQDGLNDKAPSEQFFSFIEFTEKYPENSDFLKRKLAAVVLHNAFSFGLRTIISDQIRVNFTSNPADFIIYLTPLGQPDAHPIYESKRLMQVINQLPLKEIFSGQSGPSLKEIQTLDRETKQKITQFLSQPENLRWAVQLFQLRQVVGSHVLRSELEAYIFKHPKLVLQFIQSRWFSKKYFTTPLPFFDRKIKSCQLFYN